MVLVPCPLLQRNASFASVPRNESIQLYAHSIDQSMVCSIREAVLQRLSVLEGLAGLESDILSETVDTPPTYADKYNLGAGAPFSLSHGFRQLSFLRPDIRDSSWKNIFYCGAGARPGNGV